MIDRFESEVHADRSLNFFVGRDWKKVWPLAKQIQETFRSTRYPTREQRQGAWERFQTLRTEASNAAEEERERRVHRSADHRAHIIRLADLGTPKWHDSPSRDDLKAFAAEVKAAGRYLSEYKHEMIAEHKSECFAAIKSAQEDLNAWFARFKAAGAERAQEWRARTELRIEKHRALYTEKTVTLERMEAKARELRDSISSAWNERYAARATGWLSELEDKIDNLRDFLRTIEGWIEEDERKLAR